MASTSASMTASTSRQQRASFHRVSSEIFETLFSNFKLVRRPLKSLEIDARSVSERGEFMTVPGPPELSARSPQEQSGRRGDDFVIAIAIFPRIFPRIFFPTQNLLHTPSSPRSIPPVRLRNFIRTIS